jgi:hypothetical protein
MGYVQGFFLQDPCREVAKLCLGFESQCQSIGYWDTLSYAFGGIPMGYILHS